MLYILKLKALQIEKLCLVKIINTFEEFSKDNVNLFCHAFTLPSLFTYLEFSFYETFYFFSLWLFYRCGALFFFIIYSHYEPLAASFDLLLCSYGLKFNKKLARFHITGTTINHNAIFGIDLAFMAAKWTAFKAAAPVVVPLVAFIGARDMFVDTGCMKSFQVANHAYQDSLLGTKTPFVASPQASEGWVNRVIGGGFGKNNYGPEFAQKMEAIQAAARQTSIDNANLAAQVKANAAQMAEMQQKINAFNAAGSVDNTTMNPKFKQI
jgi:hypothetical protein